MDKELPVSQALELDRYSELLQRWIRSYLVFQAVIPEKAYTFAFVLTR
jgi:hypothetical protein